ncbi:MAG: DUF1015 family protein [Verrucomicrobiota bacterium]
MKVKPFPALVPAPGEAPRIASVPYDVVTTEEARALAEGNPHSFLRVVRAELEFPPGTDPYADSIYERSRENLAMLRCEGLLVRDSEPAIYLYQLDQGGHVQTGVTLACHIEDYENDRIRKHEHTRPEKEDDRTRLTDTLSANTGPVFLTYEDVEVIDSFVEAWTSQHSPSVDFTDEPGVRHTVWRVSAEDAKPILAALEALDYSYVADGHHRSASAARVGRERREANPNHTGEENYNWFLAVLFPASQLQVLAYNRVVRDLNGLSADGFLQKISESFRLDSNGQSVPDSPQSLCLYLDGAWHTLRWDLEAGAKPLDSLDVAVVQDRILGPILGIENPRTDSRIGFVGGIHGADELKRRVDSEEWSIAFSMFPTNVSELIAIADAGETMPPKSTWFEPKLRSGLFLYTLGDEED